jgi:molecular chaperone DnaK
MIRRDLPIGSDVEVTLKISESRTIILEAYFPHLDEDFSKQIILEKDIADASLITATLRDEKKRLEELKEKADEAGESDLVKALERLESDKDRDDAARAAKGDEAAAEKAQARILELQLQLDAAEEKLKWPSLVAEARELQEELNDMSQEHGKAPLREKVDDWSELNRDSQCSKRGWLGKNTQRGVRNTKTPSTSR